MEKNTISTSPSSGLTRRTQQPTSPSYQSAAGSNNSLNESPVQDSTISTRVAGTSNIRRDATWSERIFANPLSPSSNTLGLVDLNPALPKASVQPAKTQTTNVQPSGDDKKPTSNASVQSLVSHFECPVCFDYVLPPILQCQAGHLVCSTCRPKLTCCPTCRGQLGANIRNLAMEKVASTVMFPCRYQQSGCAASLLHTEKADHEETCEFRPYSCPCPGASCKWQGALEQVMSHLMQVHKSITTLQGEDIVFLATDINLPGAVDWVMMQSCFGHHFMLVLEKQEKFDGHQQFFAIVQLIGTRKQAENFAYRLELNGDRRRMTWESTPMSIYEKISAAISRDDCLSFNASQAMIFAEKGNLGINVTISRC